MSPTTEVTIFGRLLENGGDTMPLNVARFFIRLDFRPEDRDRMHQLAEKARAGSLTSGERHEIDSYDLVGHLLSSLKSRARRALKNAGNDS